MEREEKILNLKEEMLCHMAHILHSHDVFGCHDLQG
jgi:hypothetical protein